MNALFALADSLTITNNAPTPAATSVPPNLVLIGCGIAAALAVAYMIYNHVASQPASVSTLGGVGSLFSHLKGWHQSPEMQLIGKALMSRLKDFGDATAHQLLDSALMLLTKGKAAPLIPAINQGVSAIEAKLAGASPSASPSPPPLPGMQPTHLVFPPMQHPVAAALAGLLRAMEEQHKTKQQAPAAKP